VFHDEIPILFRIPTKHWASETIEYSSYLTLQNADPHAS
jgi:hypothetical protein